MRNSCKNQPANPESYRKHQILLGLNTVGLIGTAVCHYLTESTLSHPSLTPIRQTELARAAVGVLVGAEAMFTINAVQELASLYFQLNKKNQSLPLVMVMGILRTTNYASQAMGITALTHKVSEEIGHDVWPNISQSPELLGLTLGAGLVGFINHQAHDLLNRQ